MEVQQLKVDLTEQEKAAFFRVFTSPDGKTVLTALRRKTVERAGITGGADGQMQSNHLFFTEGEKNIVLWIGKVVTAFADNPPKPPIKKRTRKTV